MTSKRTTKREKPWSDVMQKQLRNQKEAIAYLNHCFDEGAESFLLALYHVIHTWGGVGKLANESGLNRESLYKLFRGDRGARLSTVITVLDTLGIEARFVHRPKKLKRKKRMEGSEAA